MRNTTIMKSKFRGNCQSCYYTIWQNEKIKFDGAAHHLDCEKAIKDSTPRRIKQMSDRDWVKDKKYLDRQVLSNKILSRNSRPGS